MFPFLLRLFALLVVAGAARAAEPPTVAVLPLQKGAASAQYDGLGRALAGMLTSDLSSVPGLRLVERDQLDALVAELKLADGGFVDPRTAQKLGKGLGARYVVLGSFTVLDPAFALDARIVEVDSGEIVKAADAAGTVAEFVAVEKDLVEALVSGLDLTLSSADRRKLLLSAPTERFSAFTAWSEALARRAEGKYDEATAALNRALAEDPAFREAQEALGELSALVAAREAERLGAKDDARNAAYTRFLAQTVDARRRPADFVATQASIASWALRIGILEQQGRECDRYAEMRHHLAAASWRIAEPPRATTDRGVFSWAVGELAKANGLDVRVEDPAVPEYLRDPLAPRSAALFRDLPSYLFAGAGVHKRSHGLVSSLLACHPGKDALTELDKLLAEVRAAGTGGTPVNRGAMTVEDHLDLWWARTRASRYGADADLSRRTEALLARHQGDEIGERESLAAVEEVVTLARTWEDHQVRRRGLPPEEVARRMKLLAEGKVADDALCRQFGTFRGSAASWYSQYETARAQASNFYPTQVDLAFGTWAPAADFGCLEGVPARFRTLDEAWRWVESAHSRAVPNAPPDCAGRWASFDQLLDQARPARNDPNAAPLWLVSLHQTLAAVVYGRCATE